MPPITPDRWRALSPYLDAALDLPAAERGSWLAMLRAGDEVLARDLAALLAEHDVLHDSGFLEQPLLDPRGAMTGSLAGQVLGAYRLVSFIGHGGAGSVWLAERCDGRFEGRVAIKLLNLALMGRAGEERFRREGIILARMRHPHIAHLMDAGVSPVGQPYLVLEHVDGTHIDRYCAEGGLTIEARIRIFLDVLDAVAHSHANLIVHRDVKPANVLVTDDGEVKLLDFGIAKLVERAGEGAGVDVSALTQQGGTALTPEYAAPEQLAGGTVTTATDVYALGVLLYLLLTGRHPAGDALRSSASLVRAIVEAEPVRASDAVMCQSDPDARLRHARQCGTTPARLRRTLRGDLDTIVARALKKRASERYATVSALADDLRRYLRHEPISARPDTVGYRTARFIRRHAAAVVTCAAVVVLIASLTALHAIRLGVERDRAQREAAKAGKVSDLLMGLLTSVDPYAVRAMRGEPTVRALLDAGTAQVQTELTGEPDLQAEMLTLLGRTYRRLGLYDRAQQLLEQALASGMRAFGPEHVRVAQALDYLGVVLADTGDYTRAGETLEQALAMRRRLLGTDHEDNAVTLAELGRVYQDQGFNDRAEPVHREALRIRRTVLGDGHRETAVSLSDVASVLRLNGDLAGAEPLLRQCLDLNRKTRGAEHPNTAATLHDLALITAARGDAGAAEAQFRTVLAMQRKALGPRHPVVATTLNSLSHVLLAQGRHDEAATAATEALDISRAALRSDHQLVAIYMLNLAAVHVARHDPAAAEPLLREGLRIRERAPGIVPSRRRTISEDDWRVAEVESLLGTVRRASQGAQKGSPASTSRTGTSGMNDRSR
jgi:eukaryotic-like serine/threonine-protein kinase